jgi:ABC-type nitrate/sulfonate/bicarbonate transport system substrate-binding protein
MSHPVPSTPRRAALLAVSVLVLDALILLPAWLSSRMVVPAWKKGPLIDPAAPYAPENAILLAAVAVCIALDVYLLGLFFAQRRLGRRRWLPALLLLLSLAAAEGSLRAWLAVDMVTYFRPHPTLHWQVRPNLHDFQNNKDPGRITTNGDGMRGVEVPRRKEPDAFRILVLGDSSNFGHGVEGEQVWTSVLEGELAPLLPDRQLQVLNGSCPGWTTYQALVFLDEIGLAYEPDLVIAGFNNDPGPDYLGDAQRLTRGPVRWLNGLLWRSELYLLAREAVLATARRLSPVSAQHYDARQAGHEPSYGKLEGDEAARLVPRVPLDAFVANLRALEEQGRAQGYDFVWIDMPINRGLPELVERYVNPDYRAAADELSRELGFPLVRADAAFQAAPPAGLHLPGHVFHPSPKGHELLARRVAEIVVGGGLIPGVAPAALPAPPAGPAPGRLRLGVSSLTPVHAHVAVVLQEHPELAQQAGVELDLALYASGKEQGQDVAGGRLQAYFTCGVPAAHMLTSGPGARVAASPGALGRIAVLSRRGVATDLAGLAGARVGLVEGSTPAMDWEVWGQGLEASVVPLKTEELEAALLEGRVDAVVSWDPWVESWLQRAPDELVVLAERPFFSELALEGVWSRQQPGGAAALVALVERALRIAAADRERYDALVAELSGWPLAVVRAVADRNAILAGEPGEGMPVGPEALEELERALRFAHGDGVDSAGVLGR